MKKVIAVLLMALLLLSCAACGSSGETAAQSHIYDSVKIVDSLSGGGQKIGEISIIEVPSAEITDEALEDWYFNFVLENDYDYNLIVYTDKDNMGCYSIEGVVDKDVTLEPFGDGTYMNGGGGIMYSVTSDGHLAQVSE